MNHDSVVITGIGPVSAIGSGKKIFWETLLNGKSGIGKITRFDSSFSECKIAAEVKDETLKQALPRTAARRKYPRSVELGIAAANLAIQDAGWNAVDSDRIGVFAGTSVANLAETFIARDALEEENRVRPDSSFHFFNHSAACLISALFDFRGPILTVTTGCNSGMDALGHACRAIRDGSADGILVVGTDCEVFPEIFAALSASHSLTRHTSNTPRPFDIDRDGVVLAEGAAALTLEREEFAKQRGAQIYARVAGYASCAAGRNRTYSPSPEFDIRPSANAIQNAMIDATWNNTDVDLIHANGSGSVAYDQMEAQSLWKIFGEEFSRLRVHSIKSMIGLPGGAASTMQIITACLCLLEGQIPPTINHEVCDPNCGPIRVVREPESFQPRRILLHTIGLGGFYYSATAISAIP
jgi:3-oxoacyl-[acyl-carrier-protein] synthase II